MRFWNVVSAAAGLGCLAGAIEAGAQNAAPFTIRFPPDGATVRETVVVKIPLASIPEGGYVSFGVDGKFRVAVSPTEEQRKKQSANSYLEYAWNTKKPMKVGLLGKTEPVKDGPHTIEASLYKTGGAAVDTSSVRVNVQNRVQAGPDAVTLRYRFVDGRVQNYSRTGDTSILAGLSQGFTGTGSIELVGLRSNILLAVEDVYPSGMAIVRNKMTDLTVRQGGQETSYPSDQLPRSLYQEVDTLGGVHYQNETVSFEQFAELGIPVTTTLELPKLPRNTIRIGDTWRSPAPEKLDLPGTPPEQQPKVTLTSKFDSIEWEGGYPAAKIVQEYDSSKGGIGRIPSVVVGSMEITNPQIKFTREIFIAPQSGTLVKINRTVEITGKTTSGVDAAGGGGGMAGRQGGMMPGAMGGMSMPPGLGGGASAGGPPTGYMQMMRGMAGGTAGRRGGPAGFGGEMGASAAGGPPTGYMQMMRGGMGGGAMSGGAMPGGRGAGTMMARPGNQPAPTQQITLRSTLVTELTKPAAKVASR